MFPKRELRTSHRTGDFSHVSLDCSWRKEFDISVWVMTWTLTSRRWLVAFGIFRETKFNASRSGCRGPQHEVSRIHCVSQAVPTSRFFGNGQARSGAVNLCGSLLVVHSLEHVSWTQATCDLSALHDFSAKANRLLCFTESQIQHGNRISLMKGRILGATIATIRLLSLPLCIHSSHTAA